MSARRPFRLAATAGLSLGLLVLAASDGLSDVPTPKDAARYTEQLKTSKDAKAKIQALEELAKLGQIQKSLTANAVEYMLKEFENKDAKVRAAAAKAVGMVDPDPKEAVPALVKLLKEDRDESVKVAAVQGLANMGPSAKDAAKDIQELIQKERKAQKDKAKKSALLREAQKAVKSISPPRPKN